MNRIHFFEFEDQSWFPENLRELVTDYLHFIVSTFHLYRPVIPILYETLQKHDGKTLIDIGSGGSGPIPDILKELQKIDATPFRVVLTDKYPNLKAFARIRFQDPELISYADYSVDALNHPEELRGFRTFFNTFHHLSPSDAALILKNTTRRQEGMGIFELAGRDPLTLIYILISPLLTWIMTPFIRPFHWKRSVFTYLIPIVPFIVLWDGLVSCMRTYSVKELKNLSGKADTENYSWESGKIRGRFGTIITYLVGYPVNTVKKETLN